MKILITGGTGFVGSRLIAVLKQAQHEVILVTRSQEKGARSRVDQIVTWNPQSKSISSEAFQGIDAVVHLAGEGIANKRWSTEQKKRILDSRVQGTRTLVSAIQKLPQPPKMFISASAIGFYGDRGNEDLDETSRKGNGFLSDVCAAWEKEVLALRPDVRAVRLRFGVVLGKGGMLKKLLPLFKLGLGGRVGSGQQWMSWIHLEDLVNLILFSLQSNRLQGVVNAVSPTPVTNLEFTKTLGKTLHRPTPFPAPTFAIRLAMGELSCLVLDSARVLPKEALKNNFSFKYSQLESALKEIVG